MTHPIVEMLFGSTIYGTSTPASDLDYKAVHIPDARSILLARVPHVITKNTKEGTLEKNTSQDIDQESYVLQKFLNLAAEGQTVAMDMLFCPDNMFIKEPDEIWREIQRNKDKLITSKAASFIGYCRTQANKYGIRGSRVAAVREVLGILNEAVERLGAQEKLGAIKSILETFVGSQEHSQILDIEQNLQGVPKMITHLEVCNKKTPFTVTLKEAQGVYQRIFDNYGKRSLAAEKNEGIDWKSLSHAQRVGNECVELLTTGNITFPRPEAEYLIQIKTGQIDYHDVAEGIERLLIEAEQASRKSTLRQEPDREWIDNFIYDVYGQIVMREWTYHGHAT